MSQDSPLEILRNNLPDLTLSDDGKTLADSSSNTYDGTLKYTVPGTPDDTAYSLASLYLLCLHSSLIQRKRACDKYGVQNVKATHASILLSYFNLAGKPAASSAPAVTDDIVAKDQDEEVEDVEMMDVEMEVEDSKEDMEKKDAEKVQKESLSSKHSKKQSEDRRKKHHPKDKQRDKRRSSGKKDEKSKVKDKGPITNEQVMQNLTFLHGKRGADGISKRKSMELPSMDQEKLEINENTDENTGKHDSFNEANSATVSEVNTVDKEESSKSDKPSTLMDPMKEAADSKPVTNLIHENEEERKTRENAILQEALSSSNFIFSPEQIAADREATEVITAMETPVGDSASVLRFASRDFSRVLGLYMEVKKNEERAASSSGSKSSSISSKRHKRDHPQKSSKKTSSSSSGHNQKQNPPKKALGLPIIIVPNAMTSPIGMVNACDFFARAVYTPRTRNAKKSSRLTFKRRMSSRLLAACGSHGSGADGGVNNSMFQNGEIEYEIMDNPSGKLSRSEWERVVAVIAHGEKWQFKGWKWKEPVEIFTNCFGFYIGMEGAPIPKGLTGWNVRKAFLNRDKRGLDRVSHATFWNR